MCIGHAESMAAILLASGESGHRSVQPHARVMIHQPSLGVSKTTAVDVLIQAKEGEKTKQRLINVLAEHCGKSLDEVSKALDRNLYMNAWESQQFGLVDRVGGSIVTDQMKKKSTVVHTGGKQLEVDKGKSESKELSK